MKRIPFIILFIIDIFVSQAQQSYNITFNHDGKLVHGTFTTPNGNGKFPTIIINPGSGATDRDGTIPLTDGNSACLFPAIFNDTLKIYKELAAALVDSGYAVLRYDKLEYTYPTTLGTITFHKLWLPVESAIEYVKTRNDVDTSQIILIGHSEGSSLIPYIARNRADVKALISIAGPRTPFDSLLAYQLVHLVHLLRPCGATNADSLNAVIHANQILNYFHLIRTNTWNGSTGPFAGVPASEWYKYVRVTDSVAINYNIDHLPTLFLGMGIDIQVPPAELDRFKNEVNITNDFWSIPGLLHYMTPNNNPHVSNALTDTIIYWLRHQTLQTGTHDEQNLNKELLTISPNPFKDAITVSWDKLISEDFLITIMDSNGNSVYHSINSDSSNNNKSIIDLSFLPAGTYFLIAEIGDIQAVKKIIKQ